MSFRVASGVNRLGATREERRRRCARIAAAALGLMLALGATPAVASSTWRCGSRLVAVGDSIVHVLARCGEPTWRNVSSQVLVTDLPGGQRIEQLVPVETWTYDRGSRELVRYLTFRNRRLEDVVEGSYGS